MKRSKQCKDLFLGVKNKIKSKLFLLMMVPWIVFLGADDNDGQCSLLALGLWDFVLLSCMDKHLLPSCRVSEEVLLVASSELNTFSCMESHSWSWLLICWPGWSKYHNIISYHMNVQVSWQKEYYALIVGANSHYLNFCSKENSISFQICHVLKLKRVLCLRSVWLWNWVHS